MDIVSSLQIIFDSFIDGILSLFPFSPFDAFLSSFSINQTWLRWLNWFVPVGSIIAVLLAWVTAIGLYYTYSIVARWIKLIGG